MRSSRLTLLQTAVAVSLVGFAAAAGAAPGAAAAGEEPTGTTFRADPEKGGKARLRTLYLYSGAIHTSDIRTSFHCSNTGKRVADIRVSLEGPDAVAAKDAPAELGPDAAVVQVRIGPLQTKTISTGESQFHSDDVIIAAGDALIPGFGEIRSTSDDVICFAMVYGGAGEPRFVFDVGLQRTTADGTARRRRKS